MRLHVSRERVVEILSSYPIEQIERQLAYLPFRNARRPGAFIIQSIRHNYSPPKEFFYAAHQSDPSGSEHALDEDTQRASGPPHPSAQGHGAPDTPHLASANGGMEPAQPSGEPIGPSPDETIWSAE